MTKTTTRTESRWPVIATIIVVLLLLEQLPGRIRLFPAWFPVLLGFIEIMPMVIVKLTQGKPIWLKTERIVTMLFSAFIVIISLVHLKQLVLIMISHSGEISGLNLLTSGIATWIVNLLAFSLVFWQVDRGGPNARANNISKMPDWLFPQEGAPDSDKPANWRPVFVDYLFLGYCTSTAFSPTDVLPLTKRAKMLMMAESTISLITIIIVVSRAINTLGN